MRDSSFKTWLRRDPKDPYRAVCVLCDAKMIADRVVIKRHGEGASRRVRKTRFVGSSEGAKILDIRLGLGVSKQFSPNEIVTEKKKDFKRKCRNFMSKACVGIRKRFALNDPVLVGISKLDPERCLKNLVLLT